jgi:hypothetical protein
MVNFLGDRAALMEGVRPMNYALSYFLGSIPWADYRRRHHEWIRRTGKPQWTRTGTGKPHLLDGSVPILDPEFDWPDERWVADHFETHGSIGADLPYDRRALFELTSAA